MTKFLAAAVLALASLSGAAHATSYSVPDCDTCVSPIQGSFAVKIWSADTPGANINSASQKALPTNPIVTAANLAGSGTYTGKIDFNYDPAWWIKPTVGGFFGSGTGSYTGTGGSATLSSGGFQHATVIEFSFTTNALTNITISHDDGVSLFADGSTTNLLPAGAASPTNTADTTLASLAAGTYHLWYAEVNGVPAVLCFDPTNAGIATIPTATPEPASLALLGMGFAMVGFVRRRAATAK